MEEFDLDNILIDEKSHKNILIYGILYKSLIDPKLFWIKFDKIDGFITIYDGTRHLTFFGSENYNAIYYRIRCLVSLKAVSHTFFLLFCKNQSWFLWSFTCRKKIDFT